MLHGVNFTCRGVKKTDCLLGDGFRCYTEPCVFGHPYALVILLPYLEALKPISRRCELDIKEKLFSHFFKWSGN